MIVFNLPFRGPILMYFSSAAVFLIATLGVGIQISTIAETQQQSMLGGFIFIFPAILLSGIMTPVSNMPEFLQAIAYLNPIMHFVVLSRNILLKGGSLQVFIEHFLALTVLATILFSTAIYRFKKTI
jgi:ABC-2 type transport system permease protein